MCARIALARTVLESCAGSMKPVCFKKDLAADGTIPLKFLTELFCCLFNSRTQNWLAWAFISSPRETRRALDACASSYEHSTASSLAFVYCGKIVVSRRSCMFNLTRDKLFCPTPVCFQEPSSGQAEPCVGCARGYHWRHIICHPISTRARVRR